jgi:hypothetical protein
MKPYNQMILPVILLTLTSLNAFAKPSTAVRWYSAGARERMSVMTDMIETGKMTKTDLQDRLIDELTLFDSNMHLSFIADGNNSSKEIRSVQDYNYLKSLIVSFRSNQKSLEDFKINFETFLNEGSQRGGN